MTPSAANRWFAAARIGGIAAGVLAFVRLITAGAGAVFQPPFTLLLAFVAGTLIGYAILSLRRR